MLPGVLQEVMSPGVHTRSTPAMMVRSSDGEVIRSAESGVIVNENVSSAATDIDT